LVCYRTIVTTVTGMRIIGGIHSGRKFHPPAGIPARPTTDVAKEGLFNTLQNLIDIEGITTLDLFGGTGSITYELASRGAADLTLVERDSTTLAFIKKTSIELNLSDIIHVIKGDVFKYMKQCTEQFDFIFAGPPYALETIDDLPMWVFEKNLLKPEGVFVLEHTPRNDYQQHPRFARMKNYGTTVFTFFTQPA
jgi:16S rRNA (guanine966-N2)-methyltransferase